MRGLARAQPGRPVHGRAAPRSTRLPFCSDRRRTKKVAEFNGNALAIKAFRVPIRVTPVCENQGRTRQPRKE
jgi:hypothetical protein